MHLGPAVIISKKKIEIQIFCLQRSSVECQDLCRHMRDRASHKIAFYAFPLYIYLYMICKNIIRVFQEKIFPSIYNFPIIIKIHEFSSGAYSKKKKKSRRSYRFKIDSEANYCSHYSFNSTTTLLLNNTYCNLLTCNVLYPVTNP